jgi:hypothetical protein
MTWPSAEEWDAERTRRPAICFEHFGGLTHNAVRGEISHGSGDPLSLSSPAPAQVPIGYGLAHHMRSMAFC